MNKPHIVHVLTSLRTGGAEVFTVNLLKAFNKEKYTYSLITLYSPGNNNHLAKQLYSLDIPYFHLGKNLGYNPRISLSLREILKKIKPDLIHSHMYTIKYILFAYMFMRLPPWVHTLHSIAQSELTVFERIISLPLYKLRKIRPIAVSKHTQNSFYKTYGVRNIEVIRNGVAISELQKETRSKIREQFGIKKNDFVIISVARLAPPKTPHLLIDAFRLLKNMKKNCFLFIVGDGPYMPLLKKKVSHLNLVNSVFFTGHLADPFPYLSAADVYVISSESEGLPISLLEAMGAGLPVIASKVGGIPEVVEDGQDGYLVPPHNTSILASSLIKILEDKSRQKMGMNNREKIKTYFNILNTAAQYEKIYDQMLSR